MDLIEKVATANVLHNHLIPPPGNQYYADNNATKKIVGNGGAMPPTNTCPLPDVYSLKLTASIKFPAR